MKLISNISIFPPLRYESRATYIEGYHYADCLSNKTINSYPVNILLLQDVALLGIGYIVDIKTWSIIFNFESPELPFFPSYVEKLSSTWKGRPSIYELIKLNKNNLKCIKVNKVISVLHYSCSVYGHFLLEILPKIFVLKTYFQTDRNLSLPALALPSSINTWVKKYILEIWPDCKILWFDPYKEYIIADVTFIVTGAEMQQHPSIANYFIDFAINNISESKNYYQELKQYLSFSKTYSSKITKPKIFLARSKKNRKTQIENFSNIEKIAIKKGFMIIEPSEFGSLKKQAYFFSQCSIVLGEYTSALHKAIFCPYGTFIGCINYRNHYQDTIASVMGHNLNYIMPDQGPLPWNSKKSYIVSESKFSRLIDDIEKYMNQSKL